MPVLTVFAGPNGSGKSSLIRQVEFEGRENLLEPDAIARRISPEFPQRAGISAGREVLRRVLVESAWAYRHRPNVQGRVLRRQKALALSEEARAIAWKAQQRLYKRFVALTARGKTSGQAMTALARELLGFLWAIAVHTEKQFRLPKAA